MIIRLDDKDYNYVLRGTVGNTFLVEQMTGEAFDSTNATHMMYLFFVVLKTSNKEELTLDWFLSSLTSSAIKQMSEYTAARWQELEGISLNNEDADDEEKKS